jgi:hypothetical protein
MGCAETAGPPALTVGSRGHQAAIKGSGPEELLNYDDTLPDPVS